MTDDKPLTPTQEETAAIARIAFTSDGQLMHRYLRRVLEAVVDMTEASTLLVQNGRRSLARDLMRLMAEGIEASSGRTGTDQSILTRTSGAVQSIAGPRGARRRVSPIIEPDDSSGADTTGSA